MRLSDTYSALKSVPVLILIDLISRKIIRFIGVRLRWVGIGSYPKPGNKLLRRAWLVKPLLMLKRAKIMPLSDSLQSSLGVGLHRSYPDGKNARSSQAEHVPRPAAQPVKKSLSLNLKRSANQPAAPSRGGLHSAHSTKAAQSSLYTLIGYNAWRASPDNQRVAIPPGENRRSGMRGDPPLRPGSQEGGARLYENIVPERDHPVLSHESCYLMSSLSGQEHIYEPLLGLISETTPRRQSRSGCFSRLAELLFGPDRKARRPQQTWL